MLMVSLRVTANRPQPHFLLDRSPLRVCTSPHDPGITWARVLIACRGRRASNRRRRRSILRGGDRLLYAAQAEILGVSEKLTLPVMDSTLATHTAHSRQIEPTKWASPRSPQPAHRLGSNNPDDQVAHFGSGRQDRPSRSAHGHHAKKSLPRVRQPHDHPSKARGHEGAKHHGGRESDPGKGKP
jgi:hypothetical protein